MRQYRLIGWAVAFVALLLAACQPEAASSAPPPTPAQEQPEVLTRGPVHEAFAEPVNLQVQAGLVAPDEPPPNIEEIPPADRPEGEGFVWVPGYWAWDTDRKGYIWVSACWRAAPPNRAWVPGYWTREPDGWEWVAGFWAPAGDQEIEYLPAPPAADDLQPPGPPPSQDQMWVPPCYYWDQIKYTRRPGYWLAAQSNWVWVPSHYVWTPRGYVFVAGHWDYTLERRGVLFAPVYFPRSVYRRAGFSYSPSIALDLGVLTVNLFAYPRYSHYYFGDYYDNAYLTVGIYPWFESTRRYTWYDPIYEHDRWQHRRTEPRWEERARQDYDRRRTDTALRPPRTYREMETRAAKLPEPQRRNIELARPLATIVASKTTPLKFVQVNTDARRKIAGQAADVRKFRDERSRWETTGDRTKTPQPPTERREPVTPPKETRGPVTPPDTHRGTGTPPAGDTPRLVPPRDVHLTRPERVKIPAPPIVGKPDVRGPVEKGPPDRPADEDKRKRPDKDARAEGGEHKDK